jgi:outer membrane immunogenic protein
MKRILIAAAALSALASTAFAADLPARMPVKAAPMVPVQTWTGCYVGAGGGYGMWNQDHLTTDTVGAVPGGASAFRSTTGGRGWFGTAQFGCDYQFDQNWLVGAFVDGNWGSIRGDFEDNFFQFGREKEKWSWAAGGRVGYLLYPQLLTYVSGGFTSARFDQFGVTNAAGVPAGIYARHTYDGYFIGTGYEYKIAWWQGLTWKTEYRVSDFGNNERVPLLTVAGAPTVFSMNSHKYEQTVRSELVWRFNWWR